MKPAHLPAGEIADKSRGPGSSGPKRRLGRKTTAVAKDEYEQFSDELERGFDKAVEMELEKSNRPRDHRRKDDDVQYSPSSDDERWEKVSKNNKHVKLNLNGPNLNLNGSQVLFLYCPTHC